MDCCSGELEQMKKEIENELEPSDQEYDGCVYEDLEGGEEEEKVTDEPLDSSETVEVDEIADETDEAAAAQQESASTSAKADEVDAAVVQISGCKLHKQELARNQLPYFP